MIRDMRAKWSSRIRHNIGKTARGKKLVTDLGYEYVEARFKPLGAIA